MHQIITAKLKLNTTTEQRALLRQAQLAYRDALNYASRYAFEHGKTSNEPYRLEHDRAYTLHADLIGARNVAMRAFCVWQDWTQMGQLSVAPGSRDPDLSDNEANAAHLARLARYAELRWSPGRNYLAQTRGK